jgi:hypothetical protein
LKVETTMSKYLATVLAISALGPEYRMDANETASLAREMESIEARVTKTLYADLRARDFVPLIGGINAGDLTYTWRRSDLRGVAKMLGTGGNNTLPSVNFDLGENYRPIRSFATKYHWTVQQMRAFAAAKARGSSIQLEQQLAEGAKLTIDQNHETMTAFGRLTDTPSTVTLVTGLTGFVNDANVNILTTSSLNGSWSTKSPDQILADMLLMFRTVRSQTKGVLKPNTLLLPTDQYTLVTTTRLNPFNDTTIADFFTRATKCVVDEWSLLGGAGSGGVDRMICYYRDPIVLGAIAPILFQAQAPQLIEFDYTVPVEGRSGGAVIFMPLGVVYGDGI